MQSGAMKKWFLEPPKHWTVEDSIMLALVALILAVGFQL